MADYSVERLRAAIERSCLSYPEIAERIGISAGTVQSLALGRHADMRGATLVALCRLLRIKERSLYPQRR